MCIFSQVFKLPHNNSSNYLFKNIQNCIKHFHYGLCPVKTSYNDSASFFRKIFPLQISFFLKMSIFLKFSNCRKILAQTTYFENIKYSEIYIHYCLGLAKTSYNDSAFFFKKIFPFRIQIFFKNVHFSQVFKLPHKYSPNYLF